MYIWFYPVGLLLSASVVQKARLERHNEITHKHMALGRMSH